MIERILCFTNAGVLLSGFKHGVKAETSHPRFPTFPEASHQSLLYRESSRSSPTSHNAQLGER